MRLPRIYVDQALRQGASLLLPTEARHHLVNVLRLKVGAPLILFDGKSPREAMAGITRLDRKSATVSIHSIEHTVRESELNISLVQAISSADKMDLTIQKTVELGVSSIRPVFTERSQRPWKADRLEKKLVHWHGIIVHACEQSGRTHLPALHSPVSFQDYLASRSPGRLSLILDPGARQSFKDIDNGFGEYDILIGPESGFSTHEISSAKNTGILAIKMGPRILRTETAGIAAITMLQSMFGDLDRC